MASTPNYLWSFYHEFENQFIYYLTNGIGIMLVTSLVIVIFGNKKSANIVNVAAADDSLPEQKLHKYTVIIETANSLGVSCDKCTIIQFQVCGKIAKTKYYKLAAYMDDAFIFQRGNKDIFLVKTQDVLGEVEEIKILIDNKKWKPVNAEVMKTSSGEKYKVPVRVLHSDVPGDAEASEVFPVKDKGFCQTVCSSLFRNHHWLSPILVSLRFGAYTSVVNNVMIFVGIVSVLTSTLIVYIVVAPDDGDEFLFDVDSLLWCIYVTMSVFLVIAVLDIILRNVRSGYFPDIRDFLTKMKENEILPNTSNPLQTYLQSKSFNFCSVDPLKSSESSFYSIAESDKDYNKDQGILHDGDLYRSCIEFQKDTGRQQDGDLFKSCTDFHTEMELDRNASAKKNKKKSNSMTKSSTETGSPKGANNNAEQTDAATGTNVKSADSMQGKYFGKGPLARKLKKDFAKWKLEYRKQFDSFQNEVDNVSDTSSEMVLSAVTISPPIYPSEENDHVNKRSVLRKNEASQKMRSGLKVKGESGRELSNLVNTTESLIHFQTSRSVITRDNERDCRGSYSDENIQIKPVFSSLSNTCVSNYSQAHNCPPPRRREREVPFRSRRQSIKEKISHALLPSVAPNADPVHSVIHPKNTEMSDWKKISLLTKIISVAGSSRNSEGNETFSHSDKKGGLNVGARNYHLGNKASGYRLSQHILESVKTCNDPINQEYAQMVEEWNKPYITLASRPSPDEWEKPWQTLEGHPIPKDLGHRYETCKTSGPILNMDSSRKLGHGQMANVEHSRDNVQSQRRLTTWEDLGVWVDRFGDLQMRFDEPEGVPLNFSLLDALSEMDGSVITVQEAGEELRDFIKQLTSFLCSKLKHYRRKLEQGDMGCLDNADPFVTKLILSVMKCLSKYILDISFSQGLTIPVIRSRLANYQTLEKETLPDLSSIVICAVMEECTDRLMNEKTISVAHLEEISRKLLEYTCVIAEVFDQKLRLPAVRRSKTLESVRSSHGSLSGVFSDKALTKAMTSSDVGKCGKTICGTTVVWPQHLVIELKYCPEIQRHGLAEALTERAFYSGMGKVKYRMLYTLSACIVKLAFCNKDWVLLEDWKQIGNAPTPKYMDDFFQRQQAELLTVWKLCSIAIDNAQEELTREFNDAVFVYTQFLVRKLTLARLDHFAKDEELKIECSQLRDKLLKQWHKQGFTPTFNASSYLSEILMCNYLSHALRTDLINVSDETSPYYVLTRNNILKRMEIELEQAIHDRLKQELFCYGKKLHFLSHEDRIRPLMDKDFLLFEYIEIMVDQAVEESVKLLPVIRDELISEERIQFAASKLVREVIDKARYICMAEKQQQLSGKQSDLQIVFDEQFKTAVEDLKPVLYDMKLLYSKEKSKNIITPEDFVEKTENKHREFVSLNYQRVTDATYLLDDDALDKTITPKTLQELESHVTGEDKKCIPHFVKTTLMTILLLGIIFALVYDTYIGGQLNETEIKEFVAYYLICQMVYGVGLLPILALVVGVMTYIREKCCGRNG